jgi:RNA polymerase sigma factor (sigma-70 family)
MLNWPRRRLSLDGLESALERAHQGHDDSKEVVFAFLRSRLMVLARYRVSDIAEDLVQESLVVIHCRFFELTGLEKLLAFANQVLRNKIGNAYQARSRQKQVGVDDGELPYFIDGELEAEELDRIVSNSIERLGESRPTCRAILRCLYHGLNPEEISESLGISKSNLKVRTFRCREALRDLLHREYRLQF